MTAREGVECLRELLGAFRVTVADGDSLESIAGAHGLTPEAVAAAAATLPLAAGTRLTFRGLEDQFAHGDSLASVAARFGLAPAELLAGSPEAGDNAASKALPRTGAVLRIQSRTDEAGRPVLEVLSREGDGPRFLAAFFASRTGLFAPEGAAGPLAHLAWYEQTIARLNPDVDFDALAAGVELAVPVAALGEQGLAQTGTAAYRTRPADSLELVASAFAAANAEAADVLAPLAVLELPEVALTVALGDTLEAADGSDTVTVATVPPGHVGFKTTRENPEHEAESPAQRLRGLYGLLGWQVLENAFFRQGNEGLPVGPAGVDAAATGGLTPHPDDAPADGVWDFDQVLPAFRLGKANSAPASAALPAPAENPYAGVGLAGSEPASVRLALAFQDVFGNRLADPGELSLPFGYTDPVLGVSSWPGAAAVYRFSGSFAAGDGPRLELGLRLDLAQYQPAEDDAASAVERAAAHALRYRDVHFQVSQDDVTFTLRTSADFFDSLSTKGKGCVVTIRRNRYPGRVRVLRV